METLLTQRFEGLPRRSRRSRQLQEIREKLHAPSTDTVCSGLKDLLRRGDAQAVKHFVDRAIGGDQEAVATLIDSYPRITGRLRELVRYFLDRCTQAPPPALALMFLAQRPDSSRSPLCQKLRVRAQEAFRDAPEFHTTDQQDILARLESCLAVERPLDPEILRKFLRSRDDLRFVPEVGLATGTGALMGEILAFRASKQRNLLACLDVASGAACLVLVQDDNRGIHGCIVSAGPQEPGTQDQLATLAGEFSLMKVGYTIHLTLEHVHVPTLAIVRTGGAGSHVEYGTTLEHSQLLSLGLADTILRATQEGRRHGSGKEVLDDLVSDYVPLKDGQRRVRLGNWRMQAMLCAMLETQTSASPAHSECMSNSRRQRNDL